MLKHLLELIYPNLCVLCAQQLTRSEHKICFSCSDRLPETKYWEYPNNPMFNALCSRTGIHHASAFLFFQKKNRVQELLHQFKYRGDQDLGLELGQRFGERLKTCTALTNVDVMLPVPLHPSKYLKRGFNQSEVIVRGIRKAWDVDTNNRAVSRILANPTQTRKSRLERWQNVETVFALNNKEVVRNKHIALVDDVFTTGATLEACIIALQKGNPRKISVLTLACAD